MKNDDLVVRLRSEKLRKVLLWDGLVRFVDRVFCRLGGYLYREGYMSEIAEVDGLTGLFNRNFLERWGEVVVEQSVRAEVPLCVVMADLDGLKKENDTKGHQAGDRLIVMMARGLVGCLRKSDLVVRMGGDEFVVVLWKCREEQAVKKMAKVAETVGLKGVSFSFGVHQVEAGESVESAIEKADEAMYKMKRGKR